MRSSPRIGQISAVQIHQSQFYCNGDKVHMLDWDLEYISSALTIEEKNPSAISLNEI